MNSPKISSTHQKPSSKSKNNILKLLPKAAQVAVSFHNLPFSPGRDKRADGTSQKLIKSHLHRGITGPIFSMIPAEARTKSKSFETQEPTSPKISCMGQIKHKKKICRKQASLPKGFKPVLNARPEKISKARSVGPASELKKKPAASSALMKIFSGRRKSDAACGIDIGGKPPLHERAPSLSQMRKFASSRDAFVNFDWTASTQMAAEDDGEDFYSDGEDDAAIPYSAAAARAGLVLEPRKEINLWKRRTMARPTPLQLNVNC